MLQDALKVGDTVILVDLPAFPHLEGRTAEVLSIDVANKKVEVRIAVHTTVEGPEQPSVKYVDRKVVADKVRMSLVGCVVKLHSLVSAPSLNGSIGEVVSFCRNTMRYDIRVEDGVTRKVRLDNCAYLTKYSCEPVPPSLISSVLSAASLHHSVQLMATEGYPIPCVVSGLTMEDFAALDDAGLQSKMVERQLVSLRDLSCSFDDVCFLATSSALSSNDSQTCLRLAFGRESGALRSCFSSSSYILFGYAPYSSSVTHLPSMAQSARHAFAPLLPLLCKGGLLLISDSLDCSVRCELLGVTTSIHSLIATAHQAASQIYWLKRVEENDTKRRKRSAFHQTRRIEDCVDSKMTIRIEEKDILINVVNLHH